MHLNHPAAQHIPFWAWLVLGGVVVASLITDLFAHRGGRETSRKHALIWSGVWIGLSLLFCGWIALQFGRHAATSFLTAYLIEKSLSVDNLFVFLVIFSQLRIPAAEQHRVLTWGIVGAFVTRAAFIAGGAALLALWHPLIYVLGALLVWGGIKTAREDPNSDAEGAEGKVIAFMRRHLPLTRKLHGHHFIALEGARRVATPLFLALVVIEVSDVLFAMDSIPAVFSVTRVPFLVYSSNVFAILGLRALYLVLAGLLKDLKYLRFGLAALLVFAGARMLTSGLFHVPQWAALASVALILTVTIAASLMARPRREATPASVRHSRPSLTA